MSVGLFGLKPYALINGSQVSGILYDFLEEISSEIQEVQFQYKVYPYNRLLQELQSGDVELALFYPNNKAGTDKFLKFQTLGNINFVIGPKAYHQDDKSLRLGVIKQASYGIEIDNIHDSRKVHLKNYEQGIKMLSYGRISHIVIPSTTYHYYCEKNGEECNKKYF